MSNKEETYYKTCRKFAGLTQEEASEKLNVSVRTLSDYENGRTKVPDDIVDAMAEKYNAPLLAIQHIKENSPLGKYLPDVIKTQTNNDLGFQTVLASKDASRAVEKAISILEDGIISVEDLPDIEIYKASANAAIGKLLSTNAYVKKMKKELSKPKPDSTLKTE